MGLPFPLPGINQVRASGKVIIRRASRFVEGGPGGRPGGRSASRRLGVREGPCHVGVGVPPLETFWVRLAKINKHWEAKVRGCFFFGFC